MRVGVARGPAAFQRRAVRLDWHAASGGHAHDQKLQWADRCAFGLGGDKVEVRAERRSNSRNASDLTFESRHEGDDAMVCSVWRGHSACDRNHDWDDDNEDGRSNWAHMTITLPKGARLDANTGNGAVSVVDAGGDVKVNTGNGEIRVEGTSGSVRVNTGNGPVVISDARGRVQANTGNGRVRVATSSGPVSVTTGNGDIDARMSTLSKDADMQFHTGHGSVVVTVPSNLDADFDASTGNGRISTDFEIRVNGSLNTRHIRGTIGHGGSTIHITTGSGSVELRKAA